MMKPIRRLGLMMWRRKRLTVGLCLIVVTFFYGHLKMQHLHLKMRQLHLPNSVLGRGKSGSHALDSSLFNRSHAAIGQEKRRVSVLDACRKHFKSKFLDHAPTLGGVPTFQRSPIISSKHKFLMCVAAKVGSTFFTRWVKAMDYPGSMTSPLEIPIQEAKRNELESLRSLQIYQSPLKFLNSAKKAVFGRDPFARAFSAYVDKLYSPNPTYWKGWGRRALRVSGKPVTHCGSDVAFSEFVNLHFQKEKPWDFHLLPVAQECKMCLINYDFIGTIETLVPDLEHLSDLINVSSQFLHEPDYVTGLSLDGVVDTVVSVFGWRDQITQCMPPDEMGKRVWRKFQIRGIIDSSIDYPLQVGHISAFSADDFIATCKNAIARSTDKAKLKRQRKIALEEAYISLTSELIRIMLTVYDLDLDLFGYSKNREYLTNAKYRREFKRTGVFDWNSSWILD